MNQGSFYNVKVIGHLKYWAMKSNTNHSFEMSRLIQKRHIFLFD